MRRPLAFPLKTQLTLHRLAGIPGPYNALVGARAHAFKKSKDFQTSWS